jgi:Zn-dependent protease with chaperone function
VLEPTGAWTNAPEAAPYRQDRANPFLPAVSPHADAHDAVDTPHIAPDEQTPVQARSRRIEPLAVATLLPTVICFLPSLVAIAVVGALCEAAIGVPAGLIVLLWLAAAGWLFTARGEALLARKLFGARAPHPQEAAVLTPAWHRVCASAGQDPSKYSLWMQNSPELNAAAFAGRVVMVTPVALARPTHELEGVLAHELGHHLGGHSIPLTLNYYFTLPLVLISKVTASTSLDKNRFVVALTRGARRRLEFHADRTATQLGYGEHLLTAMRAIEEQGRRRGPQPELALWQQLTSTHPPMGKRIGQLEDALASGNR